jgi:hypothetical protein
MVPLVVCPPAIPFTIQVIEVSVVPLTVVEYCA